MSRPVALLGGTGTVGAATARLLAARGHGLRLAGRDRQRLATVVPDALESAHACDLAGSPASDWLEGSGVLVNCAGPSSATSRPAADLAARAGVPFVDVAGGAALSAELAAEPGAIVGAGLSPGLDVLVVSGLLRGLDPGARTVCVSGGVDELGPAGAADFVAGLSGDAGAAATVWRDGHPEPAPVDARGDVEVAHFPRRLRLHAFLSGDARRLASRRQLREAGWLSGFEPGALLDALTERVTDPAALSAAARLDTAGRRRYYHVLAAVSGTRQGRPTSLALLVRSPGAAALSALVAVAAAEHALAHPVPGVASAADVLDWDAVRALAGPTGVRVDTVAAAAGLAVADGAPGAVEEGVL